MKLFINYISFIAFLSLYSCSIRSNYNGLPEISYKYFNENKFTLSYIADDIKYITLENKVLIQRIIQIRVVDNQIFISTWPEGILVYDINGYFIRKIGKVGMGPGEYSFGTNFTINKKCKRVYIVNSNKVITYSFDGKLIREFKRNSKEDFITLHYTKNKLVGFTPVHPKDHENKERWFIYDTLGKLENISRRSITGFKKNSKGVGIINCTYLFNDKVHYWNPYNDTIFELDKYSYNAKYLFKKDQYRLTPQLAVSTANFGDNKYLFYTGILESKQFLFLMYNQYKKSYLCVYNKYEKLFITTPYSDNNYNGICNDIDGGIALDNWFMNYQEIGNSEYLVGSIDIVDLKDHFSERKFKDVIVQYHKKKKALMNLANSLDENDNPVLMFVRLKK